MTERQYDSIFSRRAVLFDQRDIPQGHEFVRYFSQPRLARILAAAVWIGDHPADGSLPAAGAPTGVRVVRAEAPRGFVGPTLDSEPTPAAPPLQPALAEPEELADLDKVLAAPNRIEELLPWLESSNSAQLYALWRLERILCGGSKHFADETLDKITRLLRSKPRTVWAERETSPCESIRRGYWPTESLMTKAGAPAWSR